MAEDFNELKVLLVEDEPEVRAMIRNLLQEFGVTQIFEASSGTEALAFTDSAFDFINFIICDWNMPGVSGVELLRQLKSVGSDVPFLMITGRNDIKSVSEAKSAGVSAYIAKPFSPVQLENKLKALMSKVAA